MHKEEKTTEEVFKHKHYGIGGKLHILSLEVANFSHNASDRCHGT